MDATPDDPTPEELARAKRIALRLRLALYGSLLVVAVVAIGVRTGYEGGDAAAEAEPAVWVTTRTSEGEVMAWRVGADGRPNRYDVGYHRTCDFAAGDELVFDGRTGPARLVWRGNRLTAVETADVAVGDHRLHRTFRLRATLVGRALGGSFSAEERWSRAGRRVGTCRTTFISFSVILPQPGRD